jgi:hypothetical protein
MSTDATVQNAVARGTPSARCSCARFVSEMATLPQGAAMDRDGLTDRVERLELTVLGLQDLPDRMTALEHRTGLVEAQILQLRIEMQA